MVALPSTDSLIGSSPWPSTYDGSGSTTSSTRTFSGGGAPSYESVMAPSSQTGCVEHGTVSERCVGVMPPSRVNARHRPAPVKARSCGSTFATEKFTMCSSAPCAFGCCCWCDTISRVISIRFITWCATEWRNRSSSSCHSSSIARLSDLSYRLFSWHVMKPVCGSHCRSVSYVSRRHLSVPVKYGSRRSPGRMAPVFASLLANATSTFEARLTRPDMAWISSIQDSESSA